MHVNNTQDAALKDGGGENPTAASEIGFLIIR
jgi:hypothetical protein